MNDKQANYIYHLLDERKDDGLIFEILARGQLEGFQNKVPLHPCLQDNLDFEISLYSQGTKSRIPIAPSVIDLIKHETIMPIFDGTHDNHVPVIIPLGRSGNGNEWDSGSLGHCTFIESGGYQYELHEASQATIDDVVSRDIVHINPLGIVLQGDYFNWAEILLSTDLLPIHLLVSKITCIFAQVYDGDAYICAKYIMK